MYIFKHELTVELINIKLKKRGIKYELYIRM